MLARALVGPDEEASEPEEELMTGGTASGGLRKYAKRCGDYYKDSADRLRVTG